MQSPKSNRQRKALIPLLALPLLLAACGEKKAQAGPGAGGRAMPVPMQTAQPTSVNATSEYLAVLKSRNAITINPQVDGQIDRIVVKSGDHVKAGTLLMQIDPLKQEATTGTQEATRASREANLKLAQQELDRTKALYTAGVVSKQALDQAQSAHDAAAAELKAIEAQVQEQRVQLRYYRITAPKDGIVGDIPVHVGDYVSPQTLLTTVEQPGPLEAYIDVPVERAKQLALGKEVALIGDDGKPIAESHITFISPQVNDATQTILAKASIENPRGTLRNAQLVRARIVWGSQPAITIPVLAVSRLNGQAFGFVAEPNGNGYVAKQRQLKLGELIGNDYVVLDGIKPGEKIITGNTQMLGDGVPVAPAGESKS